MANVISPMSRIADIAEHFRRAVATARVGGHCILVDPDIMARLLNELAKKNPKPPA